LNVSDASGTMALCPELMLIMSLDVPKILFTRPWLMFTLAILEYGRTFLSLNRVFLSITTSVSLKRMRVLFHWR